MPHRLHVRCGTIRSNLRCMNLMYAKPDVQPSRTHSFTFGVLPWEEGKPAPEFINLRVQGGCFY